MAKRQSESVILQQFISFLFTIQIGYTREIEEKGEATKLSFDRKYVIFVAIRSYFVDLREMVKRGELPRINCLVSWKMSS